MRGKPRTLKMASFLKLVLVILAVFCKVANVNGEEEEEEGEREGEAVETREEIDKVEFTEFCKRGFYIREHPDVVEDTCSERKPGEFSPKEHLPMLFTLIMICAWGALVRALAKHFQTSIPYTVLLLISGAIFGAFSHIESICPEIRKYTAIARLSPEIILYTFLPILIFESAFSMSVHTFVRSFAQIFILAFPGMVFCTFATAYICWVFFSRYDWSFIVACLFGCIVSATDPVAVVAILRDLGVSEQLGVVIDGESLMNDGVAILLFEIFHEFVVHHKGPSKTIGQIVLHIFLKFCQIALGGPVWGWIMGRVVIYFLSYVYNDATVEISATICAAYLTYWSSEYVLGVSGVIAVVVLGITIGAERTVISPESEEPVHHFWEMLGYLANTVLFVLVGIVISETAIPHFAFGDIEYLILLYVCLHIVRLIMLILVYPALKRLGYGMEWQNLVVLMWGGLRGAVGICLALQIFEDIDLCSKTQIGPKILFHVAGIVVLTLLVNGTTTKTLLSVLKLTEVTAGQREEMNNAVRRLRITKWQLIRAFQMTPTFEDTRFSMVDELCRIINPYRQEEIKLDKDTSKLIPPRPVRDNKTVCWNCSNVVLNEPTIADYRDMTNDARLRAIKSMKIHYLHLFEKGTLTEQGVQLLLADAERTEDKYLSIIQAQNFRRNMQIHGFYAWLRRRVIKWIGKGGEDAVSPGQPRQNWRQPFHRIVTRDWFEVVSLTMISFNLITVIWDVAITYSSEYEDQCLWTPSEYNSKLALYYTNYIFAAYFTIEVILRLLGFDLAYYFCSLWSYIDIIALTDTYLDLYLGWLATDREGCQSQVIQGHFRDYISLIRGLRFLQLLRLLRLLRPLAPRILRKLRRATNFQIFVGLDMGNAFVETSEAVIKFIPQMAENKKVQQVLRTAMLKECHICERDLAAVRKKFPGVAVALKTRHSCRAVLNEMQYTLTEIVEGGLLDENEQVKLKRIFEEKMRQLFHSPYYFKPATKEIDPSNSGGHQEDDHISFKSTDELPPPPKPDDKVVKKV